VFCVSYLCASEQANGTECLFSIDCSRLALTTSFAVAATRTKVLQNLFLYVYIFLYLYVCTLILYYR
jgi:hypothetical protein